MTKALWVWCALLAAGCEARVPAHVLRFESAPIAAPGQRVLSGDVDNDGHLDLVFVPPFAPQQTWLGDGKGGFALHQIFDIDPGAGFFDEHLVDLDGDGVLDLLVADVTRAALVVWRGDPQRPGTFAAWQRFSLAGDAIYSLIPRDLDADGHVDVVAASLSGTAAIFRGGLDGTLSLAGALPTRSRGGAFAVGDLDDDGHLDLAYEDADGVSMFAGDGHLAFAASRTYAAVPLTLGLIVRDWNEDGADDVGVVATVGDGATLASTKVLLGDGKGEVGVGMPVAASTYYLLLSSADLDADGHDDFISFFRTQSTALSWLQGDGRGHFLDAQEFETGVPVVDFASGDFDEDGLPDLAIAGLETAQILLQRP